MSDDEINIYPLSEARVMASRTEPGLVILAIRSGRETMHYALSVEDLEALAERLRLDALLLK